MKAFGLAASLAADVPRVYYGIMGGGAYGKVNLWLGGNEK